MTATAVKKERGETREKMERRQVLLPDELYLKCAELGKASDVSASAIIRYAVRDYLNKRGALKKVPA